MLLADFDDRRHCSGAFDQNFAAQDAYSSLTFVVVHFDACIGIECHRRAISQGHRAHLSFGRGVSRRHL
jgi:hypothetical protein